jgi:hypothetical protein
METHFNGRTLGDFLRAAEADANRFHGAPATDAWRGGRNLRGSMLVAGSTLLAVAAALLLALGPDEPAAPRVTLAAARPAPTQWFAPPPANGPVDEPADEAPAARAPAARDVASGKPPALADTSSPVTLDDGDADIAATMPASVLSPTEEHAPRTAPMNVPTLPEETAPG